MSEFEKCMYGLGNYGNSFAKCFAVRLYLHNIEPRIQVMQIKDIFIGCSLCPVIVNPVNKPALKVKYPDESVNRSI